MTFRRVVQQQPQALCLLFTARREIGLKGEQISEEIAESGNVFIAAQDGS